MERTGQECGVSANFTPREFVSDLARSWIACVVVGLVLLGLVSKCWGQLDLPPIPEDRKFVQDYAGVLSADDYERMGELQKEAFRANDTPVVVVTIHRMATYGGGGSSIEGFAEALFNHWEIGKRGEDGELIDRGILVLMSVGDREARIELGTEWGRDWDDHCARIMDKRMVPEFAGEDYGAGLLAGVHALAEMAALGPTASPPGGLGPWMERLEERPFETSPLPLWTIGLMLVTGVGLVGWFIVGRPEELFLSQKGGSILWLGLALIAGAFVFWIVLVGVVLLLRVFDYNSDGGGGLGGFSSGGGFGGGGCSGGGGASGSW